MERRNNYELAARQAETLFLNYDQQAVIQSFSLEADADYIYLDFVAKPYRITRRTGALERGPVWTRAGFEEVLSVYDILCHSGKDLAFVIPVFGSFSTLLRLWLPDDEFPAQLQFLWDQNALSFVHYETIFYIMIHVINRLEEEISQFKESQHGHLLC